MRFKWLHDYWLTLFLLLSITVGSLWLAVQHKLVLYIHPRYISFTVVMSLLAVGFVIVSIALQRQAPKAAQTANPRQMIRGAVCLVMCAGLLIMRPAGLSSSAANQRGINSAALSLSSSSSLNDLTNASAAYDQFSLKEWASLLAQTNDIELFAGKSVRLTGLISPAPDNNPHVFYVTRFVLTCCAVDARPIGVPVYKPDWRSDYQPDQWLDVQGMFIANPDRTAQPIVLSPKTIIVINEPQDPYAH
jgi:putative membrane protein